MNSRAFNLVSCGKCHKWFKSEDMISKNRYLYNIEINEKCCPYCGSIGITAQEHEKYLNKFNKTNDVY